MKFRKLIHKLDNVSVSEKQKKADSDEMAKLYRALQHKRHKYEERLAKLDADDEQRRRIVRRLGVIDDQQLRLDKLMGDKVAAATD